MKQFIEPLEKSENIVWDSENMEEEKTAQFYSETQAKQKYDFAADANIYDEILMLVI